MSDLVLFVLGVVITMVTVAAMLQIGHSEGQDPALNRNGDAGDGT